MDWYLLVKKKIVISQIKTLYLICILSGKSYIGEEEFLRFEIFMENVQKIEEHNKMYHLGKKSYYMGVNQFSHLVRKE